AGIQADAQRRRRGAPERSAPLLPTPALQLVLAPLPPPVGEVDAPAQDEIDEGRIAARQGVDRPQHVEILLVSPLAGLEQSQSLLTRKRVGEEEAQEGLVAVLDRHARAEQPFFERLPAGVRELVDPAAAGPVRGVLARDEAVR